MPLYEYLCQTCGHRFERILKSFSSEDVKECPLCHGPVERLLSAPAVQFKGSGFYSTDYGAKPPANKSQSGAETSSSSGKSDAAPSSGAASGGASGGEGTTPAKPAPAATNSSSGKPGTSSS